MMFGEVLHWIQSYCYLIAALLHFDSMISNDAEILGSMGAVRINCKLDQSTLRHCFRLRWASVESRIVFESNSSSDGTVESICSSKLADRVVCDRDTDGWFVITVVLDDSELVSNDFNLWILSRLFHCYKIAIWKVKIVHQRFISNYLGTKFPYYII